MNRGWTILLEPCEEGGFTAQIAELPEAISEGDTEEEARENVLMALDDALALRREEAMRGRSATTRVLVA